MLKKIILLAALVCIGGNANVFATAKIPAKPSAQSSDKISNQGFANWDWSQFIPEQISVDDPFAKLTKEQLDDLGYYVGLKQDIESIEKYNPKYEKLSQRKAELEKLEKYLKNQGVDINYLLSQRNRVIAARTHNATSVNTSLINKTGTISGFVIPVKRENNKLVEFFLIEESPFGHAGHNHHSPNPNQAIHVIYEPGISVIFKDLMSLTGTLKKKVQAKTVTLLDGHTVEMEASYQLELTSYYQDSLAK